MQKKNIALLIGNLYSPYSDDLLFGIYKAAQEADVNLIQFMGPHSNCFPSTESIFPNMKDNISNLNNVYDYASVCGADALIVAYETLYLYMSSDEIQNLIDKFSNIPVIVIGKQIAGHVCVTTDNYSGIKKCVEHIVNDHHRHHVCYISGPISSNDAVERLIAFKETMYNNNIPVKDTAICYGDYSLNSSKAIGELIDSNPGIDGLVSANDTMAIAAYNECEKRGLTPGKDISITGFDNTDASKSISPTLTTVEQNIIKLGMASVNKAVDALTNSNLDDVIVPVKTLIRESCGGSHKHLKEQYFVPFLSLDENIEHAVELFERNVLNKDFVLYSETSVTDIEEIIRYITSNYYSEEQEEYSIYNIKKYIDNLCDVSYYNISFLSTELSYLITCILFSKNTLEKRIQLSQFINIIQDYIYNYDRIKVSKRFDIMQSNLWNTPMIVRNIADSVKSEEMLFTNFMNALISMYIKRGYIFINNTDENGLEHLELTAEFTNDTTKYYHKKERVTINNETTLFKVLADKFDKPVAVYNIYTENHSYGILLCEIKSEYITSLYCASFQIGTALKLFGLTSEQYNLQMQLHKTINALNNLNSTLES